MHKANNSSKEIPNVFRSAVASRNTPDVFDNNEKVAREVAEVKMDLAVLTRPFHCSMLHILLSEVKKMCKEHAHFRKNYHFSSFLHFIQKVV